MTLLGFIRFATVFGKMEDDRLKPGSSNLTLICYRDNSLPIFFRVISQLLFYKIAYDRIQTWVLLNRKRLTTLPTFPKISSKSCLIFKGSKCSKA